MSRNRLHSLRFVMEELAYLARYTSGDIVIEVRDCRNDRYTLHIGEERQKSFRSVGEVEDEIVALMPEYVKGSRVWEEIEE